MPPLKGFRQNVYNRLQNAKAQGNISQRGQMKLDKLNSMRKAPPPPMQQPQQPPQMAQPFQPQQSMPQPYGQMGPMRDYQRPDQSQFPMQQAINRNPWGRMDSQGAYQLLRGQSYGQPQQQQQAPQQFQGFFQPPPQGNEGY